ncbi:MAG: MBL fold metallo-hydrolase, partial [Deltaproteobacteria bacterium]
LLHGAKPVKAKTLFIEGTYAGTEHPDRKQLEKEFLDEIEDTVKKGGKVVIPAFAVGRTQELAILLYEAGYEVWLDGMGSKIAELIIKHGNCIKSPKKLNKAMKSMNIVYSNHGRKLALKSGIVLTTSGMLNGGPVLWYIDKIKDDSKSAVFITGYQVEGTNGRMLLEKKEVNIYGVRERVDCRVKFFDFSAHAGHSQLVNFVKSVSPENVVIFHSENPEALADEINANVIIPENEKEIEI